MQDYPLEMTLPVWHTQPLIFLKCNALTHTSQVWSKKITLLFHSGFQSLVIVNSVLLTKSLNSNPKNQSQQKTKNPTTKQNNKTKHNPFLQKTKRSHKKTPQNKLTKNPQNTPNAPKKPQTTKGNRIHGSRQQNLCFSKNTIKEWK